MAKRNLGRGFRPSTGGTLPGARGAGPMNNCITCGMKADFGRKIAAARASGQMPADGTYSGYIFGIAEAPLPPNVAIAQPNLKWVLNCMMAKDDKLVGSMSIPVIALPEVLGQMFKTLDNVPEANAAFEWAASVMEEAQSAKAHTSVDGVTDDMPPDAIDVTPPSGEDEPEVIENVAQFRARATAQDSTQVLADEFDADVTIRTFDADGNVLDTLTAEPAGD